MVIAAISTGPETHLDHLAPLCALLEIPLIVTQEQHLELGLKFYPMIDVRFIPLSTLTLDYIASHFDTILTCGKFWAIELKPLIKLLFNKEIRLIFAPHGNSDKEELLDLKVDQDIDLAYGPQMLNLKKEGKVVEIGNIRLSFYQKHQAHFDRLAQDFFSEEKTNVLYAPTWESKATTTSFFESTSKIIDSLKCQYNLMIKLHPLLEENNPAHFHRLIGKYENRVRFILNYPPIYPLLEKTSIYLGDFSSVGYDFLTYNRPMFFLKQGGRLNQCGQLFSGAIDNLQEHLSSTRQLFYRNAFGSKCCLESIKMSLLKQLEF